MIRLFLLMVIVLATTGCAADYLVPGMYDGFRIHSDLQPTPSERSGRPDSPSYSEYERMRKERSGHEAEVASPAR